MERNNLAEDQILLNHSTEYKNYISQQKTKAIERIIDWIFNLGRDEKEKLHGDDLHMVFTANQLMRDYFPGKISLGEAYEYIDRIESVMSYQPGMLLQKFNEACHEEAERHRPPAV